MQSPLPKTTFVVLIVVAGSEKAGVPVKKWVSQQKKRKLRGKVGVPTETGSEKVGVPTEKEKN